MFIIIYLIFLFFYSCFANGFENLVLISPMEDTQSLNSLRITIGKKIKSSINNFLYYNPKIKKNLDNKNILIKVIPQSNPHYTHLYLGEILNSKQNILNDTINESLNAFKDILKDNLEIILHKNSNIFLLNNFIVFDLPNVAKNWNNLYKNIDQNLKLKASIEISHFLKFSEWKPHVTLHKITNREVLEETDQKTNKKLREIIIEELKKINENIKKDKNIPNNLAILDLSSIDITKKEGRIYKIVTKFKFDKDLWKIVFPVQVKVYPEDLLNLTLNLNILNSFKS